MGSFYWGQGMSAKYAILADGGFMIRKLCARGSLESAPLLDRISHIKEHADFSGKRLFRVYFYHAWPYDKPVHHPLTGDRQDLGSSEFHRQNERLLHHLELQPDFSLRLGELDHTGWKLGDRAANRLSRHGGEVQAGDFVPDLRQKGVDLRIGMDIAKLSLQSLVDEIVVITGDSDIVPSLRFARREGLRVYLDHLGHGVKRSLKADVDRVLEMARP